MAPDDIVLVRYRKGLRIGAVEEAGSGKVRLALEKGRSIQVPEENVLLETGLRREGAGGLATFRRRVEETAEGIDLREVWELVRDEAAALGFRDIAELHESDAPGALTYAAMLLHLESAACPYFELEDETRYAPVAEEKVAERRDRLARQERETREDEAFLSWLAGESAELEPRTMTPRQSAWLDRLRSVAVLGDESPAIQQAKRFLAKLPGGRKAHRRAVFDLLVERGVFGRHENLLLHRLSVPLGFDRDAETEAEAFDPGRPEHRIGRRDLTELEVFSIDDEKTRDVDDAVSVTTRPDGYLIGIHVTDLTAAARPGSALDEAASERVTSLYFPEERIPMLPPALSEGSGSLVEGEERLALSLLLEVDRSLAARSVEVVPSVIINRRRLEYGEAERALEGGDDPSRSALETLEAFAALRRDQRTAAGAVEIQSPELAVRVDEDGRVEVEVRDKETRAQLIVSELMVLYNVEAARLAHEREVPLVYRSQEGATVDPEAPGLHPALARHRFFKSLAPSNLALEPRPHRLLGVETYAQLSSPLRRYLDLVHQRQVVHLLGHGSPCHSKDEIAAILHVVEERLWELRRLEPERTRYWLLRHLEGRRGERFEAVVLEPGDRQSLVEILDPPVRTGAILREEAEPGAVVTLRLEDVDPFEGTMRLVSFA